MGFHDAALYRAEVTTPPDQTVVATGTEITRTVGADGWVTTRYVMGPAREFTMLLSPRFQMAETETLGTRIRSYFRPEDADAGRAALRDAVAALQVYSDRYGPYPYRDMAIVGSPLDLSRHGVPRCEPDRQPGATTSIARTWRRWWCMRWRTSGGTTRSAAIRS